MTKLAHGGLAADLPPGWEGRIQAEVSGAADPSGGRRFPIMHLANFPLPNEVADYGGGAVELMQRGHAFVALLEFAPENAGTPLFQQQGLRLPVQVEDFDPTRLQRLLRGQSGLQQFFTVEGRAFGLYVVVGSHALRATLMRDINAVLAQITFD